MTLLHKPVPLTPYQQDIFFEHQRSPHSHQYTLALVEHVDAQADVEALIAAVEDVINQDIAGKLRIVEREGELHQEWASERCLRAQLIRGEDLHARTQTIEGFIEAWAVKLFDLQGTSPLLEAAIVTPGAEGPTSLLLRAHHIVCDAWGLNVLRDRIILRYRTRQAAPESISDRIASYLTELQNAQTLCASGATKHDLRELVKPLESNEPALFNRRKSAGKARFSKLQRSFNSQLVQQALTHGISPYQVMIASLALVLARIHNTAHVTLGIPLRNRREENLQQTGQWANTLPLSITVDPAISLLALAGQVKKKTSQLKRYEHIPLSQLVNALSDNGNASRQLFDVSVSYLHYPTFAGQTENYAAAHESDALAIHMHTYGDGNDVQIDLQGSLDVFNDDYAFERFADSLTDVMRQVVEAGERWVSHTEIVSPEERRQLQCFEQGPAADFSAQETLSTLFEQRAAADPEAIAVRTNTLQHPWSYRQLQERVEGMSEMLHAQGVQPGDTVAIMMERSPEMLAAIFAILKRGAAYLPIDPAYPAERIDYILQDSGVEVIVAERLLTLNLKRHYSIVDGQAVPTVPAAPACNLSAPMSLAYMIYTSGSTGWPKGVMIEHRSAVNRIEWMQERYPLDASDVILQKTPISFDVSVWELFWWSITGASVALLPPGAQKDPLEIIRTIREQKVTTLHFVPSMLQPFLDTLEQHSHLIEHVSSLRRVFTSGEALPPARVNQFRTLFSSLGNQAPALINLYGPTEATVDVSYFEIFPDSTADLTRIPIGYPINNTALRIMSRHDTRQPIGVAGELQIGGVGLARGYHNKPELTDEKFIFDADERWYRTGDLARWLPDGSIEYLGRIDNQVKIRGNRIELGEIQNTLENIAAITHAEVLPEHDDTRGTHLCAYYVANRDYTPEALRGLLLERLPEFMIPAKFIAVPLIPLTPNGKADRKALSRLTAEEIPNSHHAPTTETEKKLAEIWQRVLNLDSVVIHDSFYSLGGDSILMLKVRSEAENVGIRVTLAQLAQHLTLSSLSRQVEVAHHSANANLPPFALIDDTDRARLTDYADAYPATQLQLGLIYHSQQAANSATYKDVFRYTLETKWEPETFRASVATLLQRHPALRSHFNLADFKTPLQVINHTIAVDEVLVISDLSHLTQESAEQQIVEDMQRKTRLPYQFDRGPLFGIRLFRTSRALELVLHFHHAILDGGSVANLLKELLHRYAHNGAYAEDTLSLPSPALYVQDELHALAQETNRSYWQQAFAGLPRTQLVNYRLYDAPAKKRIFTHTLPVPDDIETQLQTLVRQRQVSTKSVFFAAHCLTVALFAEQNEIATGLVTHGRPEVQNSEHLLGLFLNTLPVRFTPTGKTWHQCVQDVFATEQRHSPHRWYPLNAIQQAAGEGAKIGTAFNYIHFHVLADVFNTPDMRLLSFQPLEETNFELLLNVMTDFATGHNLLRCDFDSTVFSQTQAEMFLQTYMAILRKIVSHGDESASLSLALRPLENDNAPFLSVVEQIERTVRQTPDSVALQQNEECWSYRKLWEQSGKIAGALQQRNVTAGTPVAIALERSPQLIVTLLGVMRAGAGCLPLDLSYPHQRIEAMIEQAQPPLIIVADTRHQNVYSTPVVTVDTLLQGPEPALQPVITAEQLAYLLFTSGSTGKPKGVAMPHRGLANLVAWQNATASGQSVGVTLQYAPMSFDVSFQEIFSTLSTGGRLQLVSDEQRRDPAYLLRLIEAAQVERIYLPYVALQQLAETAVALNLYPQKLRVVISSGEQLRVTEDIRTFIGRLHNALLENQYGPTETHVITAYAMSGDPATFPALPPIGYAIDHADVLILDDEQREVTPGIRGEIYARGAPLALGYYRQPELSAERFITLPGQTDTLYRTGDLGIKMADGAILCLGRKDAQTKVRGYRIEPAEIELAIASTPGAENGLKDVAVVVQQRGDNDLFLVAFLVGTSDERLASRIAAHLTTVLPSYMIPSQFVWLDSLPKTPSGKRDDAELRKTVLSQPQTVGSDDEEPRDDYERILVDLAADLLKLPTLSVHQNLFDVGGTSLTAMRLVVLVEKHFGVSIPLSVFVSDPTIAQLAQRVRNSDAQAHFSPLVPMRTTGNRRPLFFVHPMGGNVLSYLRLVKHFPADQPFYALQAHGVDAGSTPLTSVPQQAANYLQAIRKIQPAGPYSLGGWSYGGFVAFEMARQLKAAGEQVTDLFVLDTVALNAESQGRANDDALLRWFFWELLWLNQGATLPEQFVPEHVIGLQARFDYITEHAIATGAIPQGSSRAVVQRLFEVYKTNWKAATEYSSNLAEVDMTLLHATRPLPEVLRSMHDAIRSEYRDPKNGWDDKTAGRLKVIDVPGDHLEIMEEPYVAEVAKVILQEMQDSAHQHATLAKGTL